MRACVNTRAAPGAGSLHREACAYAAQRRCTPAAPPAPASHQTRPCTACWARTCNAASTSFMACSPCCTLTGRITLPRLSSTCAAAAAGEQRQGCHVQMSTPCGRSLMQCAPLGSSDRAAEEQRQQQQQQSGSRGAQCKCRAALSRAAAQRSPPWMRRAGRQSRSARSGTWRGPPACPLQGLGACWCPA